MLGYQRLTLELSFSYGVLPIKLYSEKVIGALCTFEARNELMDWEWKICAPKNCLLKTTCLQCLDNL